MWKRRHIRSFFFLFFGGRLTAACGGYKRAVGLCGKAKATFVKVSPERSETSLAQRPHVWCLFFFFKYACVAAQRTATEAALVAPRGSGPCTGAQRSFISVTVCKQQLFPEAFAGYFWHFFSLTSFKDSK